MKNKIVLVPFPFDGQSATKVRPALCLTDSIGYYDHVVIAFITSQIATANENSDLLLFKSEIDFLQTGLRVDSAVRLHRLVTIPVAIIQRQLGQLPDDFQVQLHQKLRALFGL